MRAFAAKFECYLVAADLPAAVAQMNVVRAAARERGVEPGAPRVTAVSDDDLSRVPALQRLVDAATRPQHGPPASDQERYRAGRALAEAAGGDVEIARGVIAAIEGAFDGYLPRTVALRIASRRSAA